MISPTSMQTAVVCLLLFKFVSSTSEDDWKLINDDYSQIDFNKGSGEQKKTYIEVEAVLVEEKGKRRVRKLTKESEFADIKFCKNNTGVAKRWFLCPMNRNSEDEIGCCDAGNKTQVCCNPGPKPKTFEIAIGIFLSLLLLLVIIFVVVYMYNRKYCRCCQGERNDTTKKIEMDDVNGKTVPEPGERDRLNEEAPNGNSS